MMSGFDRRLARLEGTLPSDGGIQDMTDDELAGRLLELAREVDDTGHTDPAFRDRMRTMRQVLEDDIRRQAARHRDPDYRRFLAELKAQNPDHVPAVFGADTCGMSEYGGHRPREMARRTAVRARPDIAALIAEGMAA